MSLVFPLYEVYAYGLDGVTRECVLARNPNVIGYPIARELEM